MNQNQNLLSIQTSTFFSFVCSVDRADPDDTEDPDKEDDIDDEFAQFVNASTHPPNELSVPRCYPDPNAFLGSGNSEPVSQRSRSQLPRPCLRRESAQDIEDVDLKPNINIELVDQDSRHSLSISTKKRLFLQVSKSQPFGSNSPLMQRSAPGTPLHYRHNKRRTKSRYRTDSDESGHLRVPLSKTGGISLPDGMDDQSNTSDAYLLRHFDIKGRKVLHLGDFYRPRASSYTSLHSNFSWE